MTKENYTLKNEWKKAINNTPENSPYRLPYGQWTAEYSFYNSEKKLPQERPTSEILDILRKAESETSGWPPWLVPNWRGLRPKVSDSMVTCSMIENSHFADAAHADFWLATSDLRFALLRGYEDDASAGHPPGTCLDFKIPYFRVLEVLIHALRVAQIADISQYYFLSISFEWTGLRGRTLTSWSDTSRQIQPRKSLENRATSTFDSYKGGKTVKVDLIRSRYMICDIAENIVSELFRAFHHGAQPFAPYNGLVHEILDELLRGRRFETMILEK